MSVWAIADLHLSFGVANKQMSVFGEQWKNHAEKIRLHWTECVRVDDLVLLAGDFSWAMTPEEAQADFEWLDALPGTKVLIKGNHDYWWNSLAKVKTVLPASCHLIQNDAFRWNDVSIGGARLWDTHEYNFNDCILFHENVVSTSQPTQEPSAQEKIFIRELQRLETSLKALDPQASKKVVMTHYPPISSDLKESRTSRLLEKYRIDTCVFGHLHSLKPDCSPFGEKNGVKYVLTSCDFLHFAPLKIF